MKLLIDGDVIAYRCGFAGEKTRYDFYNRSEVRIGEDPEGEATFSVPDDAAPVHTVDNAKMGKAWMENQENGSERYIRIPRKEIDPVENVLHTVKVVMDAIKGHFERPEALVYFSCSTPDNWRTAVYPEYKGNRKDRKPFWYKEVREYMEHVYKCTTGIRHEADDLIAIEAYAYTDAGVPWVIVSIDKDFQQIPGQHYNWVKEEMILVNGDVALQNLAVQRIAGDGVDNIKGVPGIGDAKARAHLMNSPAPDLESMVLEAYTEYYEDPNEAVWQEALNTAMVTLPEDLAHVNELMMEVVHARKAIENTQADSTGDDDGSTDADGTPKDAT